MGFKVQEFDRGASVVKLLALIQRKMHVDRVIVLNRIDYYVRRSKSVEFHTQQGADLLAVLAIFNGVLVEVFCLASLWCLVFCVLCLFFFNRTHSLFVCMI